MSNKLLITLCVLFLLACTRNKRSEHELVLCTNHSYPPYESMDKNGKSVGFDIDVAEALAKALHKNLKIKEMAFDSLILSLDQNKCDFIMAGMSITESRKKKITLLPYQGQIVKSYTLLFWKEVPTGVTKIGDLSKVGNNTISVLTGTVLEEYLKLFPEINTKALESTTELILDIQYQKSISALVETYIAKDLIQKQPLLKPLEIPIPKSEWNLGNGIGIKKSNLILTKQIQEAIGELQKSGQLRIIEQRWFSQK